MTSKLRHNLARVRIERGLTQAELAHAVGCSAPTIQAIELCRLTLSIGLGARLGNYLGVSRRWLLDNDLNTAVPSVPIPMDWQTLEWL